MDDSLDSGSSSSCDGPERPGHGENQNASDEMTDVKGCGKQDKCDKGKGKGQGPEPKRAKGHDS